MGRQNVSLIFDAIVIMITINCCFVYHYYFSDYWKQNLMFCLSFYAFIDHFGIKFSSSSSSFCFLFFVFCFFVFFC
jgi:hypothetical protein